MYFPIRNFSINIFTKVNDFSNIEFFFRPTLLQFLLTCFYGYRYALVKPTNITGGKCQANGQHLSSSLVRIPAKYIDTAGHVASTQCNLTPHSTVPHRYVRLAPWASPPYTVHPLPIPLRRRQVPPLRFFLFGFISLFRPSDNFIWPTVSTSNPLPTGR